MVSGASSGATCGSSTITSARQFTGMFPSVHTGHRGSSAGKVGAGRLRALAIKPLRAIPGAAGLAGTCVPIRPPPTMVRRASSDVPDYMNQCEALERHFDLVPAKDRPELGIQGTLAYF